MQSIGKIIIVLLMLQVQLSYAVPATPAAPRASLPGLYIDLNWQPVTGASYYLVEPYRGGTPTGQVQVGQTTLYQMNVVPGQIYQFLLKACDSSGCSAYSAASNVVTVPQVPARPAAPLATLPGLYLDLSWNKVANASYYLIEPYENTRPTGQINVGNVSLYQRNVTIGHNYQFLLKACNTSGCSAYSPASNVATVPQVPVAPAAPVAVLNNTTLNLNWDHVAAASFYLVEPYQNGNATGQLNVGYTRLYQRAVTDGNSYQFLLKACNSSGCSAYSAASNLLSVPQIPAKPAAPLAKLNGSMIDVSWQAVSQSRYYKVEPYEGGVATGEVTTANVTSYRHPTRVGRKYQFLLKACNNAGCSPYSPASAVVLAPPITAIPAIPATPKISATGTQLQLSWGQISEATSYQLELFENNVSLGVQNAGDQIAVQRSGQSGKNYKFYVKACNSLGCSAFSPLSNSLVVGSTSYLVSTNVQGSGSVVPVQAQVEAGKTAVFMLNSAAGATLQSVTGCGGTLTGQQYTTAVVTANCTVSIVFGVAAQNTVVYLHTDVLGSVIAETQADGTVKTTDYKPFGDSKEQ